METLHKAFDYLKSILSIPLMKIGKMELTLWTLIYLAVLIFLLIYLSGKLKTLVADRLLAKRSFDMGVRQAIASILRYAIIAVGFIIILQTAGIDLTTLNVLAGALGIGVGFGLQNIVGNFISGLIILFERPIKIGDRIEVGDVQGDVIMIKARSTTVVTNDNIAIIVPNSSFITQNVVNWSHTGRTVRFRIPVSVSYSSDVHLVKTLLLEVAAENPDVLDKPAPDVRFVEFGDSSLNFDLLAWSTTLTHRKGVLISALNFAIIDKFRAHGIEIPFPQRDIHIIKPHAGMKPADQPPVQEGDE